jgi:aspartate racemase
MGRPVEAMRTLGLIGGTSWESTAEYYRIINQFVARERGGLASAKLVLYSLDFEEVRTLAGAARFEELRALFAGAARALERAGAEAIVICSNSGHLRADAMMSAVSLPLLHIADAIGEAIASAGIARAGLIGARQTMELPFLRDNVAAGRGIEIVTPEEDDRARLDEIIFGELAQGKLFDSTRREVIAMMDRLHGRGAGGIVLGCTELPLLIRPGDVPYPTFDTTELHALACARWSLRQEAIA